jgi:ADP-heptose:LPS heptosyltransferase
VGQNPASEFGEEVGVREQGPGLSVGERRPRFADVHAIAVLRGSGLGDLVQALPAAEALAAAYPTASVTLLGTPAHVALLEGRPSPFTSLEVLPLRPGVRDGSPEDPAATAAFLQRMRSRGFDLAVQLHGGGRNSNPFLLELGARHTVGSGTADAAPLERTLPYLYYQHEVMRTLEVVGLAGAVPVELEPRLRLRPDEAEQLSARRSGAPVVALHPGATDPRRRWPASAFAEVASTLAADGARVVVVGDESDVPAATEILAQVRDPDGLVSSRAGAQSLPELVATLLASDVVLANDSGPRHIAAALGVRTVGIYWVGNVLNAGPLGRVRNRLQIAFTTRCPVCDVDITQVGWTAERCPHDGSIVADVQPGPVLADVRSLLADARRETARSGATAERGGRHGQVG